MIVGKASANGDEPRQIWSNAVAGNITKGVDTQDAEKLRPRHLFAPLDEAFDETSLVASSPKDISAGKKAEVRSGTDFGSKRIGFFAGCTLLINNITGPGVPELSNMFAEAGWLLPILCLLGVWVMTTLAASMYCEAMRKVPGNENFRGRIEYTTIVKWYFGQRWYVAAQVGFNGAMQSLNIISIVQCAKLMDNLFSLVFGKSCALDVFSFIPFEPAVDNVLTNFTGESAFSSGSHDFVSCQNTNHIVAGNIWGCHFAITCGFVFMMLIVMPCTRWNLEDSMLFQKVAFLLTVSCWVIWTGISFAIMTLPETKVHDAIIDEGHIESYISAINTDESTGTQSGVLGMVLFNFGFVTTVPSWVNEREPGVSINKSLWGSTFVCMLVFVIVGLPGAVAFQGVLKGPVTNTCEKQQHDKSFSCMNSLVNILADANSLPVSFGHDGLLANMGKCSAFVFPMVSVASTIPVISIIVKYNMLENGFSKHFSFFWGGILPWVVALPMLYMPNFIAECINITSLVFVTLTDFIVPLMIYRRMVKFENESSPSVTVVGNSDVPGSLMHHAFKPSWGISVDDKRRCAAAIAAVLTTASLVALVQTVSQAGSVALNEQTCSQVGS